MSEQSICQARASVMVYDDTSKKWVPIKPGQQGFSRINIYHNTANNTFRVVGVKLQDQQVVINYSIVKGLKYNQATPTFHQWRDARQVYGLNFASKEEATTFSNAMLFALNVLSSQEAGPPAVHRQNGPVTDDSDAQRRQMMEQHQMQAQMERERRAVGSAVSTLQFKVSGAAAASSPSQSESVDYRQYRANTLPPAYIRAAASSPSPPSPCSSSGSSQERDGSGGAGGGGSACHACDSPQRKAQQQLSQLSTSLASAFMPVQPAVNTQGRKHGTWSASSAAMHMFAPLPAAASSSPPVSAKQVCPQPVLPVALPLPPLNNSGSNGRGGKGAPSPHDAHQHINGAPEDGGPGGQSKEAPPAGLAAALAGAKLRKVQRSEEASGPAGVKNDGNRSSGGSGGSGEGLMQEMNAILARRRKASEKPDEDNQKEETNGSPSPITRGSSLQNSTDLVKKPWDRANSTDKSSAVSRVKPVGTSSDGDTTEYDRMKQEILEEVVRELHKVKDEIIDAIRREVTRLSLT
ncbi:hypothetical protein AALO_G00243640 [Alosa alosa]|uniref:Ena/VASP-like protein n=1 Tax=Alosa alosa TaxID=278164 RepID=A0AAV6FWA7_9TELE|nr:hypothetical protein AALO_G00243640 [Alosa alosa]